MFLGFKDTIKDILKTCDIHHIWKSHQCMLLLSHLSLVFSWYTHSPVGSYVFFIHHSKALHNHVVCFIYYYMTSPVSGKDEPNVAL